MSDRQANKAICAGRAIHAYHVEGDAMAKDKTVIEAEFENHSDGNALTGLGSGQLPQ